MEAKSLPATPRLEQFEDEARELVAAREAGALSALGRLYRFHPRFHKLDESELRTAPFDFIDAQQTIAFEYAFASWSDLAEHIKGMSGPESAVAGFEAAADAIVDGDPATLNRLLLRPRPHGTPCLARSRSTRRHRATLLHYVAANGVEDFRQRTPSNALEIARLLLDAGAEVDAVLADGESTTLGLVATSLHPRRAGLQIPLIDLLLAHGASIDGIPGGWNPLRAALRNGHGDAAAALADRGARLDLVGAAGVGNLDSLSAFFDEYGGLNPTATEAQLQEGFHWACEYGRTGAVGYLLERGADLAAQDTQGMTGLHWAVIGGDLPTVRLLLRHGPPLEVMNHYGGTALGQAIWAAGQSESPAAWIPIVEALLTAGADPQAEAGLKEAVGRLVLKLPSPCPDES